MAASEMISSSWKSPFSTPIRKDENACKDIFQNSEKLLASAVSICRLKGSVECQTGGLITVCEELQSLIRLAFSEIKRLEKHLNSQRSHYEDEISFLKERVEHLEKGNGRNKHFDGSKDCKDIDESADANEQRTNQSDGDENIKDTEDSLMTEDDGNLEDSDPNLFDVDNADVVEIPADDALPVPPKEQKTTKSPQENQKSKKGLEKPEILNKDEDEVTSKSPQESKKSKKRLKKLTSRKVITAANSVSEVDELCPSDLSSGSGVLEVSGDRGRLGRKSTRSNEKSPSQKEEEVKEIENEDVADVIQESESEFKINSKGGKGKAKLKKMKKKETASVEESDENCPDQTPSNNTNHHKEIKDNKKGKKKKSVDKEDKELEEVLLEENFGDDVFEVEAGEKTKGKKKRDSSVHEKPEGKSNRKLSCKKKEKSSSDDTPLKTGEEKGKEESETIETLQKKPRASNSGGLSSKNEKSSKKESAPVEDKEEQLGDMTFLININSQIAVFVADSSQEEFELQPMTARERNAVYKVTQLYKLRARIGTKEENNLTTVRLSKQADTRMPKPGRVDSLLSELSIAASKEAVKESPKNQVKRKRSTHAENEQTTSGDSLDQAAPPKKKLSRLSKTKRVN